MIISSCWGVLQTNERRGPKKNCNIVGGRMGNYTKFIYFFHGPNSSKSAKKFFLGGVVGRYLTSASSLHFIFEATA